MPGTSPLLSGLDFSASSAPKRETVSASHCHPGLDPGSRATGTAFARLPWTPDQVRGDNGGTRAAGDGDRDPCPDPAERPETRLYQRLAPGPPHLNRTAMEQVRARRKKRRGPPTALPVTEGFPDEHRCDMPTRGSNMPTPRRRARGRHLATGICRRQCRQAGRVGRGRHSRSASAGCECRVGSDLSTRCLCRRREPAPGPAGSPSPGPSRKPRTAIRGKREGRR